MYKYKIIKVDIYRTAVLIFIGSQEELTNFLKGRIKKEAIDEVREIIKSGYGTDERPTKALTMCIEGSALIFAKSPIDLDILVHECAHATRITLENIGAYPSDNDEPYAYLMEYLFSQAKELCTTSS